MELLDVRYSREVTTSRYGYVFSINIKHTAHYHKKKKTTLASFLELIAAKSCVTATARKRSTKMIVNEDQMDLTILFTKSFIRSLTL